MMDDAQGLHRRAAHERGVRGGQAGGREADRRDRAAVPAGRADRRLERLRPRRHRQGARRSWTRRARPSSAKDAAAVQRADRGPHAHAAHVQGRRRQDSVAPETPCRARIHPRRRRPNRSETRGTPPRRRRERTSTSIPRSCSATTSSGSARRKRHRATATSMTSRSRRAKPRSRSPISLSKRGTTRARAPTSASRSRPRSPSVSTSRA